VKNEEIRKILQSALIPTTLVLILWIIKMIEVRTGKNFAQYGLFPRDINHLYGILTSPFIHADWKHLFNNSVPIFILGWALFHFYNEVAWKIILWVTIMAGFWTWISARASFHIGASGLLYGMFSFLLFSGFIRRNKQLISLSFLVAFLYGSLVWGLLPIDYKTSWESHLWGFVAGGALALYYRKKGIQREKHVWDEEEEELLEHMDYWKKDQSSPGFRIIYKKKEE
jgi:membrane associated rhomboid family serine protease